MKSAVTPNYSTVPDGVKVGIATVPDGVKVGIAVSVTFIVAVVGIFSLGWYCSRQQTKKAKKEIFCFGDCWNCRRRQTMRAFQRTVNNDEEMQIPDCGAIETHRTTCLAASYVELRGILPPKELKMYFRQLKIDECTIQRIETEHHGNVREQCYQLFLVWERMRTNKTKLSHIEWSLELIRKLKHHIDEFLKDMPDGLKQQCYSILDAHSLEITKTLPRLNSS